MLNKKQVACSVLVLALPLAGCSWVSHRATNGIDPHDGKLYPPPVAEAPAPLPPPPPPPPCQPPAPGQPINLEGCKTGDTIVLRGVNFDFNKATLTVNAKTLLDQVADALLAHPGIKVEIAGHTDGKGSDAYNDKLSERRAFAVKDYLAGRGVDSSRMTARGYGKSMPIADNGTEEGREYNRRVEMRVTSSTASASAAPAAPAATAPAGATVAISNMVFVPASLTVPAGTTVTWTNGDASVHIVKFPDQASPGLATGANFSKTFNQPGDYYYQCGVHSQMTGRIIVK